MANNLVVLPKFSQSQLRITGYLFQSTFYVADQVEKIKAGYFVSVSDDPKMTSKGGNYGDESPTLVYADEKNRVMGICYDTSAVDQYGRTDNFENEEYLYAYGKRESLAIGPLKECVMTISNLTKRRYRHYYTLAKDTGVALDVSADGTLSGEGLKLLAGILKVGDKVSIEGVEPFLFVKTVGLDTVEFCKEDGTALDSATAKTGAKVKIRGQYDDKVYFNVNQKACAEGTEEGLPFLPFITGTADWAKKPIGRIESPINVRILLD